MSNPPNPDLPDMHALLRGLRGPRRQQLLAWLEAREQVLQAALVDSARAMNAVSALLAETVALRGER